MADMELVIKIDENAYHRIISGFTNEDDAVLFQDLFKKGVILPKGHGDLKDTDDLKHAFIAWSNAVQGNFSDADIASIIYNSPTIIKTDNEVKAVYADVPEKLTRTYIATANEIRQAMGLKVENNLEAEQLIKKEV